MPAITVLMRNPELQTLLQGFIDQMNQGSEVQWSEIVNSLQNSEWGRNHLYTYIQREIDRSNYEPEFFDALLQAQAKRIKEYFAKAGAVIDDASALDMAEKQYYQSETMPDGTLQLFDQTWFNTELGNALDFSKTKTVMGIELHDMEGLAGQYADKIYKSAYDYGIDASMTNTAFEDYFKTALRGIFAGSQTVDDATNYFKEMALSKYPGLANQIMQGQTVRTAADPYLRAIGDTLEIPNIDLNDSLVQSVLNTTDEKGNFKPMNLYEVQLKARKDPRWQYTQQATDEYTSVAAMIAKDFGFM
jgi:hypothetical protein